MDRALSKLPAEDRQVTSKVHQALLNQLQEMRYSHSGAKRAERPKKKDKLPPGASYTCAASGGDVAPAVDEDADVPDSSDNSESESDSETEEQHRRLKEGLLNLETEEQQEVETRQKDKEQKEKEKVEYLDDSYVVVVYEEEWYVGQVVSKEGEPEAEESDDYVLISFMKRTSLDHLQWPMRTDMLNVLREDILFSCQVPVLAPASSSSRSLSYLLPKSDLDKAKKLFMIYKAYCPTKTSFFYNLVDGCVVPVLFCCACVSPCVNVLCVCVCVRIVLGRKVPYSTVRYRSCLYYCKWDNISGKENSSLKRYLTACIRNPCKVFFCVNSY